MDHTPILATTAHKAPRGLLRLADRPRRGDRLGELRRTLETWRWRLRFRWELERKAEENPHLIEDIGLTRKQIEAEIGKPFWQR